MTTSWRPRELKYLTAAVAVALLAAPTIPALAANSRPVNGGAQGMELRPVTAAQRAEPTQIPSERSGKSYFWSDAAITAGVLAGVVAFGFWGDLAVGGAVLGIQLLCGGAAIAARKVGEYAGGASQRVRQVIRSNPAAASR